MDERKQIEKTFVKQQDSSDCGVACLRSVVRYWGGDISFERLRELSGTNREGSTLLGLFETAEKLGFDAQGCKLGLSELVEIQTPTILHVLVDGRYLHYVVWYGAVPSKTEHSAQRNYNPLYLIGDPSKGVQEISETELLSLWGSKVCLILTPNEKFVKNDQRDKEKRKWFRDLIREDIGLLVAAAALGLFIVMSGLTMSIFSQKLIDNIIPLKNQKKLFSGVSLVTFILLVRICLESLKSYMLLKQSEAFNNRIIGNFQRTLFSLPKLFFDYRNEGDLIARMNDTSRIQRVISQLAGQVLADLLIVLISTCVLFFYSWQAAAMVLISLPFFFVLIYRFHNSISKKQREVMSNYAVTESNYISTLQGIAVVKSFNRQSVFEQQNRTIYGNYQKSIFELGLIQLRLNGYASVAAVIILMTVLSYISYEVLLGGLKPGELMAVLGITSTMLPSVSNLALLAIPVNEAKIAFDRMFEFVGLKPENTDFEATDFSLSDLESVEFRNVTFRFPGRKALLNDITLKITRGEIIGIIGVSGSGKSSLIQLMERFYLPASGQIIVNDSEDLSLIPLSSWRNHVVSVPQDVHLFNGTVLDNILLGRNHDEEELISFLGNLYFQSFISSMPQGLNTLVGDGGINISGGQKQWVGLLRALFQKPKLLLLDEATAAMDPQNELNVIGLLKTLRSEMAIVYVSHRLHTLPQLCGRMYILGENRVIRSGTHYELLESENVYSQFWRELIPV